MQQSEVVKALKALGNPQRLTILAWLKDPTSHFPAQRDGDLVKDGVCGVLIADKLGLSQPTISIHMRLLLDADLVKAKRIKRWTFYRRNESRLRQISRTLVKDL